jgi:fucose 4-O-acetylase-like acetyltransferase
MKKENARFFESGKTVLVILIPFLVAQAYFLWANLSHETGKYMFVEYFQPFIFLLIAGIGCAFIICFTFYLQKKNVSSWLTYLGRHSLYIYVAHVMAFAAVRIILNQFFGIENVVAILISGIFAALIIPLLLYNFAVRNNIRWIFTLEKVENKENNQSPQKVAMPAVNNND